MSPFLSPLALALAAVVMVALFGLMRRGAGEGEAASRSSAGRAVLFALLGGLVVLLLGAARQPAPKRPAPAEEDLARAFRSYTQAVLEARRSFVGQMLPPGETPEKVRSQAIRDFRAAVRDAPSSRLFRRQLAILLAFEGNLDAARAQFRRLAEVQRARGDPAAAFEARLWDQVAGPSPPPATAVPRLRERIAALRLGWFEHLALAVLYRRAGQTRLADEAVARASNAALVHMVLLGLAGVSIFLIATIGFIAAPIVLYLAGRGTLRRVPFRAQAPPAVLWEAFLLYMFLYALQAVPHLLAPEDHPSAAEASAARLILLILASDAVQLLGVLYLWLVLRQRRCGLAEVGLHARELPTNLGFGVGAYVLALPWVLAVAILTQWISDRYFPNVAPPFHPLQALTAGTQEWWLRAALFMIAVVGAPFLEELFFRGALYGALRQQFGVGAGVVGSSALFAALHPQLPLGFVPIFFLGAVFCMVYEWRQSLLPGLLFHSINNGVVFLIMNLLFPPGG